MPYTEDYIRNKLTEGLNASHVIILIVCFALVLRWSITYHPHSGQGKPPMFGDYEAQRHWQEITFNLPVEKWYINSTDNDLQYWGLDYPPLTAYHSLLLGHIANSINCSYVKLHESRGISSDKHKYFMRLSVLCADCLIYVPAMIYFMLNKQISSITEKEGCNVFGFNKKHVVLLTAFVYPGLTLIDYGHFQYNCVSLGLFIAATAAILRNSFIFGSFLFVMALNYKQMELYHALPFFFYILGRYTPVKTKSLLSHLGMLTRVTFTVALTFIVLWLPFLRDPKTLVNVVLRLFPFARGVFEDKVANIWCAINVVYKLRNVFTNEQLAKICLVVTVLAVLPSCINLYLNPKKDRFVISLINSALAFFLFSFQVHEKSILLAAVPVLLHFHRLPFPCFWFLLVSHFSMLPLFIKDDLYLAYMATLVFYFIFISWAWPDIFHANKLLNNNKSKQYINTTVGQRKIRAKCKDNSISAKVERTMLNYCNSLITLLKYQQNSLTLVVFYASILGMIILSIASGFLIPPKRYPDLYPLLISLYSCGHFIIFYLYFNYKQFCMLKNTMNKSKVK